MTQWKEAPGFPAYQVSERGEVRRIATGRLMRQHIDDKGRASVSLRADGKTKSVRPSRLVALAFIGPAPFDGAEACHRNGRADDNRKGNLRWDTSSGNKADMVRHGTRQARGRHSRAKISPQAVRWIKERIARGELQREVASRYGVTQAQISRIVNGRRWK